MQSLCYKVLFSIAVRDIIGVLSLAAEENNDALYENSTWKVHAEGDITLGKPTVMVPAEEGEKGAHKCDYFILVNKEGGRYAAMQTQVPYKRVIDHATTKVGATTDAEEKDYEEYDRTSCLKRLERAERARR